MNIQEMLMNGLACIRDRANMMADDGRLFNFEYSSEDVDIVTPAVILFKTGKRKVKYLTTITTLGSTVTLELFTDPTISANGTEIVPVNYNALSDSKVPMLKLYHTPTKSANGTSRYVRHFLGYSQGNVASGASASGVVWRTLQANSTYLAVLTAGADNTKITYSGDFYETN